MKKIGLTLLMSCVALLGFAQLNMELLDDLAYTENLNDVWGWTDPDTNIEYALVGTRSGLSIVTLETPTDVSEIQFIGGPNSTWRDIKTWGNHIYVTNETSNGVLVVDMTDAPDNITWFEWEPNIPGLGVLSSCHNIYIDEFGYAYLAGCNLNGGGMLMIDVFSDPGNPQFAGAAPAVYAHDVYTQGNKMYASEIYSGNMSIYDVSDKSNVQLLGQQQTAFAFTHNVWLNDAGTVAFTTDEQANAPIGAYDVSDPSNIIELDQFIPASTVGTGVVPHNVQVWNDWVIISYYTDGGIVIDGSKPDNLIEVGNFDTFFGGGAGFNGVWGAYPYFESEIVLLTDIGEGLYVLQPNYVNACWLEGKVTDAVTGLPIFGASIDIDSPQANFASSDFSGEYKTGQAIPGTFDVTFAANGYFPQTIPAELDNGLLTILDVQLVPINSVSGSTVKSIDGSPVPNAQISFVGSGSTFSAFSNDDGTFVLSGINDGTYTIYAGAWGYLTEVIENVVIDDLTGSIVIELTQGYRDDFALDLGWTSSGDATTGAWTIGEPIGTIFNGEPSNPEFDIEGDLGDQCYMTGNGGGGGGTDDVDNGTVILMSPIMPLANFNEPVLSYYKWFVNEGGNGTPNDVFQIRITNGSEEVVLETISQTTNEWTLSEFVLTEFITLTNEMQVIFETSDLPGSGHIVEAAIDLFSIEDSSLYPPFLVDATTGCTPFTVQFTDQSDSTATWAWTFENGEPATSNEQNPEVLFATPGSHNVTLTVTTDEGNTYIIDRPNYITVQSLPEASFDIDISGNVVNFTSTSVDAEVYSWDFDNGDISDETNPSVTYNEAGTYSVTLVVSNPCGQHTITQVVEISVVPPVAFFMVDQTEGCTPFTVSFTDQSTGNPDSYEWNFPGGEPETSTAQNPQVIYNAPGIYSATLTVTNAAGMSTVVLNPQIEVESSPVAGFLFDVNEGEVTFTNTSEFGLEYTWDFGDNNTSTNVSPTHTFTETGEYDVTLTVSNGCGSTAISQVITVTISSVNELDIAAYKMTTLPNPFSQQLTVNYELKEQYETASLNVYNLLGQQMESIQIEAKTGSVELGSSFSNGLYFLRLQVDGKISEAVKVIKTK